MKIGGTQVDTFTWAYIVCLFWLAEDEIIEHPSGSFEDVVSTQDAERLHGDTLIQIIDDCTQFQDYCMESGILEDFDSLPQSQAGNDFALSRNGHGTGYWDRGDIYTIDGVDLKHKLHDAAKTFGEFSINAGNCNTRTIYCVACGGDMEMVTDWSIPLCVAWNVSQTLCDGCFESIEASPKNYDVDYNTHDEYSDFSTLPCGICNTTLGGNRTIYGVAVWSKSCDDGKRLGHYGLYYNVCCMDCFDKINGEG